MVSFGLQAIRLKVELQSNMALCGLRRGLGELAADAGSGPVHAVNRTWPSDGGPLVREKSERRKC